MKYHSTIALLLLAIGASNASAQTMKPGLWEVSTQMQGGGQIGDDMAQALKQMESMPPEQRKMMQDMMAKQGVKMGTGSGGGISLKVCMTQEMVDRNEISGGNQNNCTHTYSQRTGNAQKFSFSCTKPSSSGEGVVTFTSAESYSMKMTSTTNVRGAPEKMEMQNNGRWLGGDCGSVKPIRMPRK
jgi:hypothetical protein